MLESQDLTILAFTPVAYPWRVQNGKCTCYSQTLATLWLTVWKAW